MCVLFVASIAAGSADAADPVCRAGRVIDGDTIELRDGQRVRLVQIDTPEVYGGYECYGRAASTVAKRLLTAGTAYTCCWSLPATRSTVTDDYCGMSCVLRTG